MGDACGAEGAKPNVVYIMADDLGWTDVACFGSRYYETPHIDGLAAGGMKFDNGYTCGPNCQPTRAALLSGQYGPRTGVYTVGSIERFDWRSRPLRPVDNVNRLPLEKVTIAQALKAAGYATGMFGKWHLGDSGDHHPSRRGFDEALVSAGQHFNFKTNPQAPTKDGEYLADFLTDRAEDFIRRHKDEPFFLYLPHFGVHSPHEAKEDLVAKFKDKPGVGGHNDPTYAAMISSVDDSVGRIVALLDELQLTDNTLVVFTSDNGGVGGYAREGLSRSNGITDNAPLRGGKGMLYEGGVRVPFIFRWPGKVAAGSVSHQPICSVDIYPTLLQLAGGSPPQDYVLDGESLVPVLASGGKEGLKRDAIYWHFPGYLGAGPGSWRTMPAGAVRSGDYKLIEFFEDGRLELYNLADDLSQQHNLAASEPERVKELHQKLVDWREQVGAKMPAPHTEEAKPAAAKKKKARAR
jgi:arylsulfatase A-like enzyme